MATAYNYDSERLNKSELHNGDCMTQSEFHELYEQTAEGFRAELINGVVYVCEPLGLPHGKSHIELSAIFAAYQGNTPGVEAGDNVSVILGKKDEVQPDLLMRILPEKHGRSGNTKKGEYVEGPPELIAEVAHTSRAIDLHLKKQRYARAGVLEYIVLCLRPSELRWFDLENGGELQPDDEGIYRSNVFPGLWINRDALLKREYQAIMNTLNLGLASPQHAEFAKTYC
jgi:Uma2 family endonuclease